MLEAAKYSAAELLRDGRTLQIRALRPDDRAGLQVAADRISPQSMFLRFFAVRTHFSEKEVAYFTTPDFVTHVALVALVEEGGRQVIVGGGRYVMVKPGVAELAFAVIDAYQGHGIGTMLLRHLIAIARDAKLHELIAEVLPENKLMLAVFKKCGLPVSLTREGGVVRVTLRLV